MAGTDGGYVIVGTTTSNNGDISGFHGGGAADCWVFKVDRDGNLIWQRALGGSGYEIRHSVTKSSDGGYAIACESGSNDGDVSDGDVSNKGLSDDAWIVKLDASGRIIWQKIYTHVDAKFGHPRSIVASLDGGYVFVGVTNPNDSNKYVAWLVT